MPAASDSAPPIGPGSATDIQVMNVERAHIRAIGGGNFGAGNRSDARPRIEAAGRPNAGTVTQFVVDFFPAGDTRLTAPFYNNDRTVLTVTQSLDALPGWIAALTDIVNEEVVVSYTVMDDRYEFECLRRLTDNSVG